MRVVEYDQNVPTANQSLAPQQTLPRPPSGLIAAKLIAAISDAETSLVYIALSESTAAKIAHSIRCLDPDLELIVLPPWDCLPYDRVPPSRQCMGRRMDALRVWSQPSSRPKLMVTSLDVVLQRIPPSAVIENSWFELVVGEQFDKTAFESFARRTGYIEDGLVDEPGEYAFRDDVIDIFPAGGLAPMRIVNGEDGSVAELRSYDPTTQRTQYSVERMVFGPASEAVPPGDDFSPEGDPPPDVTERELFRLHGDMQTVFDILGQARISFAPGTSERLERYIDIIDEARQAHRDFGDRERETSRSLYLDHADWKHSVESLPSFDLVLDDAEKLPVFALGSNPRKAFGDYAKMAMQSQRTVVIAGQGKLIDGLCRRLERGSDRRLRAIGNWSDVQQAEPGSLLRLPCALERGFIHRADRLVVIAAGDVLGDTASPTNPATLLAEPELQLGDAVVHEDHGVGVLKGLETIEVDAVPRDTARLEYRDGASILVPMEDFGKLWRYGSEADAVILDRLHTDGWAKKRAAIAKDIRGAARHLMGLAKLRHDADAAVFVPPRTAYTRFVARFPYAETADQAATVEAVLTDLASGKVMNRLVCGDVGFGKTEVALRAAAAVALAGGQVVVVAPTTVLARQHFTNFTRRFSGTGVEVAMLSRIVSAHESKRVKAGLASGEIGIVVATQAILAKDVAFSRLGLLIVDEEHRFGTRDKQSMKTLAPLLHTLAMSATPIPRTLQAALIGVQDVSLLTAAPAKRRPVRTSLSAFDRASMRVALLRERRRGGQSFVVAPQIQDLDHLQKVLSEIVPELSVRVAHGKMPAAAMDDVMVSFADGDGDILLSTNIIESGLDVPRANTIFVWRADRFGLAQLHQLRGRVGRARAQGIAYLLTATVDDIPEETRLRLSTLIQNDRLGAGLAISLRDLDLRGAGDIAGEDQAGHMKVIGVSLYQKLLERAVAVVRKRAVDVAAAPVLNLGIAGTIPADYVPDATLRLNIYARLLRAHSPAEVEAFVEELEDRFGEMPDEVLTLLRLAKLKITAITFGICKLEAGPHAMAIGFDVKPTRKVVKFLSTKHDAVERDNRLIYERPMKSALERIGFFEAVLATSASENSPVLVRFPDRRKCMTEIQPRAGSDIDRLKG